MDLNTIKTKLFRGMAPAFQKFDFLYNENENEYQKIIDGGSLKVYFLIEQREDGIYIDPRWAIELKSIFDIYRKVSLREEDALKHPIILENSLGQLIEYVNDKNERGSSKRVRYVIENEADVEVLKKVIPLRIVEYVLPYFNLNSSVARVDELLNTHPRELVIHQWLNPYRMIMGTIAAILTNNPKLKELIAVYDEKMKKVNVVYRQEYENLKSLYRVSEN